MNLSLPLLRKTLNKWRKIFNLGKEWTFNLEIKEANDDTQAQIIVIPDYFRCDLTVYPNNIKDFQDLEAVIGHEFIHILIKPLELALQPDLPPDLKTYLIESTTERLTKLILAVRKM